MVEARLAVALDTTSVEQAESWAAAVQPSVGVLKVGLEFYLRHGAAAVAAVRNAAPGCGIFLDLKLHDIPATVAGACRSVAPLQPEYLTVHAGGGRAMIAAAAEALPGTRIAAVTALTSLGQDDLAALGLPPADQLVPSWARLATEAGAEAIVCSALEVAAVRAAVGPDIRLITPGIRPAGSATQDQQRVATPTDAVLAGADELVVGRPITGAADPAAAAAAIAAEIATASHERH